LKVDGSSSKTDVNRAVHTNMDNDKGQAEFRALHHEGLKKLNGLRDGIPQHQETLRKILELMGEGRKE
jgi:hypothetical protein